MEVNTCAKRSSVTEEEEMYFAFNRRVRKIAKSTISFVPPSAWNNSAPTGQIFMKFDVLEFFENMSRKFKVHLNLTRITSILHEDVCTFVKISRWILLTMTNVSDKLCRENQNKILCSKTCSENRAFYEIMWKNMVQPDRPQMTI
jgi:hypothetical protein